jgi:cytochrome c biogenesis protein CcdA
MVYKVVENRSIARGDSEEQRQSVVHRGLLFSSGIVAGEAIMGIVIAVLIAILHVNVPFMKSWAARGAIVDVVSLAAFFGVMALLYRKVRAYEIVR